MAIKRRTDKELASSLKGRIFATARKAFGIGNRQEPFTEIARKRKDKKTGKEVSYTQKIGGFPGVSSLASVNYPSGAFYAVTKPDGPFFSLGEDTPQFKAVRAAAGAAYNDVLELKWTSKVQTLLNEMMKIRGERKPGQPKGQTTTDIQNFTF